MRRLRGKLTYANVMATVAVFIALGGGAYAATQLPKNSVGTKQLRKNSVTPAKIKNRAVTPAKVSPETLAQLKGAQGPTGSTGPAGPSDAYIDRQEAIQPIGVGTPTQVAALSLSPGSYTFAAKLIADNDTVGETSRIECTLDDPNGNHIDFTKVRLAPTNPPNLEFADISLAGALTLNVNGAVSVQCIQVQEGASPPLMTVGWRKLIAIKVGALHP
jgi:hypothetical protein